MKRKQISQLITVIFIIIGIIFWGILFLIDKAPVIADISPGPKPNNILVLLNIIPYIVTSVSAVVLFKLSTPLLIIKICAYSISVVTQIVTYGIIGKIIAFLYLLTLPSKEAEPHEEAAAEGGSE